MKNLLIIIAVFILRLNSFGQENNADNIYVKSKKLDKTFNGRFVHIEFTKNTKGLPDTITLTVNNIPMLFEGRRVPNEQGRLFYGQYLQSEGEMGGYTLRLVKSRIDDVTNDSIQVTSYFDFYTKTGALAAGKSIQQQYWFSRKNINGLLLLVNKTDM